MTLARHLHRVPSVEELADHYQRSGLGTGEDLGHRRERRINSVIKWLSRTFEPDLVQSGFREARPHLQELITAYVGESTRQNTCYRFRVTDEDLAVALYVIERGSFTRRMAGTVAMIMGMFKMLTAEGVIKRSCDRNKATALKLVLERAGLCKCVSTSYRVGVYGKAYGIGPSHPRYVDLTTMAA